MQRSAFRAASAQLAYAGSVVPGAESLLRHAFRSESPLGRLPADERHPSQVLILMNMW